MPVKFQDYYETLGVSRNASVGDIRKAYRTLARKWHPDVNKSQEAEDRFKAINEAYEVLKDPEKRRKYDALGENWKSGQDFRQPPGFDSFAGGSGFNHFRSSGDVGGFSDFFETLFGNQANGGFGGGGRSYSTRGFSPFGDMEREYEAGPGAFSGDVESEIVVPLKKIIKGGQMKVNVMIGNTPRSYDIRIPKGIAEGRKIRLAGQGQSGGDLFLRIKYGTASNFTPEGYDLITDLWVTPWEAALGSKLPVETLDGKLFVRIPAGSASGKKLRIKSHGLPKDKSDQRGDLLVRINIATPTTLSKRERELFEQMAEESEFCPRAS